MKRTLARASAEPVQPPVNHDLGCLAPGVQLLVTAALSECNTAGDDAYGYETCRTEELQLWYFLHGASHARTAVHSWHAYGLAVDVISKAKQWDAWGDGTTPWARRVSGVFKSHGMAWGGDWHTFHDWPHFEFGRLPASPTVDDIILFNAQGKEAVWDKYGAR